MATSYSYSDERRMLRGVLSEAMKAQERTREALEEQLKPRTSPSKTLDPEANEKLLVKAQRRAERVPSRIAEVEAFGEKLADLQQRLKEHSSREAVASLRKDMETLGLGQRIETFDLGAYDAAAQTSRWGCPGDFDGLVVYSPLHGIPILISKQRHSDAALRRVSRGADLWFQARGEGRGGSRVLLRTSMCRSLKKPPRECMEVAACFAAFFSDSDRSSSHRRHFAASDDAEEEPVEVIWTDSRHVAKRGGRVGQLKDAKKLGVIRAEPWRVRAEARDAQEEQGWL